MIRFQAALWPSDIITPPQADHQPHVDALPASERDFTNRARDNEVTMMYSHATHAKGQYTGNFPHRHSVFAHLERQSCC